MNDVSMNQPATNKPVASCATWRSFSQGGETIEVLRGIHLEIRPGEIVALLGPSGSGKSTMLQAIGLLEGGFEGVIEIAGVDASSCRRCPHRCGGILGFVYQFHHLLPDFNAVENVVLPQLVAGKTTEKRGRGGGTADRARVGSSHGASAEPAFRGEQQRVAVARALANRPALVLADEPTGNLDEATADRVLEEFLKLVRGQGSAALVATHNERLAFRMDRVLRLHEGMLE
jgi:lipoprotein-releasing system ATP-binding protein